MIETTAIERLFVGLSMVSPRGVALHLKETVLRCSTVPVVGLEPDLHVILVRVYE